MARFFCAGGALQSASSSNAAVLHKSSGTQKTRAIRMTSQSGASPYGVTANESWPVVAVSAYTNGDVGNGVISPVV